MHLNLTADEVLTTTRAVRKRLDLQRPVEREVIMECLDIALQAPTGSNSQGWRWLFITDPERKQAIAEVYLRNFIKYREIGRLATYADDDPRSERRPQIQDSSTYLAEHFGEVPVLMIPLMEGRLDGLSAMKGASTWGSILPAVWSFMLALRERGMGSAWTTIHLLEEQVVADICGIPFDRYTQCGLFPIAYTLGTEFQVAKRIPSTELTCWDTFSL